MILVLDVGNTSTTVGLYNGEELVHHFRIPSDRDKTVKEFQEELDVNLGSVNIEGAIIGSVVEEINDRLCYAIQYLYKVQPVLLSSTSNTGITLSLKNNSEKTLDGGDLVVLHGVKPLVDVVDVRGVVRTSEGHQQTQGQNNPDADPF